MRSKKEYWIERLNLRPHPEGGHYAEVYRSGVTVNVKQRVRAASTSIYYLLGEGDRSLFHRLLSDETWYFHDGDPLELLEIGENGELVRHQLGNDPESNRTPQLTIASGRWFAARSTGKFSLVGCHVAPGFDFQDFEMAKRDELLQAYPALEAVIVEFTAG